MADALGQGEVSMKIRGRASRHGRAGKRLRRGLDAGWLPECRPWSRWPRCPNCSAERAHMCPHQSGHRCTCPGRPCPRTGQCARAFLAELVDKSVTRFVPEQDGPCRQPVPVAAHAGRPRLAVTRPSANRGGDHPVARLWKLPRHLLRTGLQHVWKVQYLQLDGHTDPRHLRGLRPIPEVAPCGTRRPDRFSATRIRDVIWRPFDDPRVRGQLSGRVMTRSARAAIMECKICWTTI